MALPPRLTTHGSPGGGAAPAGLVPTGARTALASSAVASANRSRGARPVIGTPLVRARPGGRRAVQPGPYTCDGCHIVDAVVAGGQAGSPRQAPTQASTAAAAQGQGRSAQPWVSAP